MKWLILALALASPLQQPEKKFLVLLGGPTTIYFPTGHRINVPMGTEIDVCPGGVPSAIMLYHLDADALEFINPCVERPLFSDGFESNSTNQGVESDPNQ